MNAGWSLCAGVAAAAPLVGFAAGIVLGQRWPSVTGVGVTAPGNGTPLVLSVLEGERGWDGFAKPALGTSCRAGLGGGNHVQIFSSGSLHLPRAQPLLSGPLWIRSVHSSMCPLSPKLSCCTIPFTLP